MCSCEFAPLLKILHPVLSSVFCESFHLERLLCHTLNVCLRAFSFLRNCIHSQLFNVNKADFAFKWTVARMENRAVWS